MGKKWFSTGPEYGFQYETILKTMITTYEKISVDDLKQTQNAGTSFVAIDDGPNQFK